MGQNSVAEDRIPLAKSNATPKVAALVGNGVYRWRSIGSMSASGVLGNLAAATREKGERLLAAMSQIIATQLLNRDFWALPWTSETLEQRARSPLKNFARVVNPGRSATFIGRNKGAIAMRHSVTNSLSRPATIRALAAVLLLGAGTMLSGCNTTAGAGQDVAATGHAITNTADKVKSGL